MDGSVISAGQTLDRYKRLYSEAQDLTQTARLTAQKHRRYYDGKIDDRLERQLRDKKQPDFVINRVRPGVEGMVGVVDKGRSDPKAYPRTPKDDDSSEVATDALRYTADVNRWNIKKLDCFRNMCVEGIAAVVIDVDDKLDVIYRRIRYEEFFYDPHSRELDFSDASYMGVAKWMYGDALAAAYPDQAETIRELAVSTDGGDSTWADRPEDNNTTWTDAKRRRLLVVEMYHLYGGEWTRCVFVGSLLLEQGPSPFLDNDGKPCCPIEAISAYADDENRRYGVVADMVGPQDEINVYRRKAAHFATFRQVQETDPISAYADKEEVRTEAAKPDGVIPPGYGIVPNDKFGMDMTLLQEAKAEIERIGPNPAILGRQGAATSGRAALIREQAGLTELAHLYSRLEDFELRVFRQTWSRQRQYWTEPKFLRVTDDEDAFRFVHINEPIWSDPVPTLNPETLALEMVPQFMGYRNAIAEMDVDIIIDTTPDTANVQQEQFQTLVELAKAYGPEEVPFEDVVEMSGLRKKREFLDRRKSRQQQKQAADPLKAKAAELELASRAADIENTSADTENKRADALKTMGEVAATQSQPSYFQPGV